MKPESLQNHQNTSKWCSGHLRDSSKALERTSKKSKILSFFDPKSATYSFGFAYPTGHRGANPLACASVLIILRSTNFQIYMFLREKLNFFKKTTPNSRIGPSTPRSPPATTPYYSSRIKDKALLMMLYESLLSLHQEQSLSNDALQVITLLASRTKPS